MNYKLIPKSKQYILISNVIIDYQRLSLNLQEKGATQMEGLNSSE
jgi:hypothetical protein